MAQWNGQYTGNTHSTKVEDLEETLRHAVDVFYGAEAEAKVAKGKAVHKLAEKLLTARLKLLKAKIYDVEPVIEKQVAKQNLCVESLRQQEMKMRSDGVNGILTEFEAQDLIV